MLGLTTRRVNLKVVLNVLYIICDTIFSVIIFAMAKKYLSIIIIGLLLVTIRVLQKLITLYYNYRDNSAQITPQMPKKIKSYLYVVPIISIMVVAVVTYFFNKHASISSLVNKIGNSGFIQVLAYIISIWAMISVIISIYPAIWHIINKIRKKEETKSSEHFSRIIPSTEIKQDFISTKWYEHGYYKITPEVHEGQIDINKIERSEEKNIKLIQEIKGNKIFYYNAVIENDSIKIKVADKSKIKKCKGFYWNIHSIIQSKKMKLPITILDYLADMPFMFFAIYFAALPSWITTFLTVCVPFGLVECILFNIHYFNRKQEVSAIIDTNFSIAKAHCKQKKDIKLSGNKKRAYLGLMSTAFISAASKFFIRFFPIFHVSIAAGINYHFAITFAIVFGAVYMLRNIANMINVRNTIKQKINDYKPSSQIKTERHHSKKFTPKGYSTVTAFARLRG